MNFIAKRINVYTMSISKIPGEWWLDNISILHFILLLVVAGKYLIIKSVFKVRKI